MRGSCAAWTSTDPAGVRHRQSRLTPVDIRERLEQDVKPFSLYQPPDEEKTRLLAATGRLARLRIVGPERGDRREHDAIRIHAHLRQVAGVTAPVHETGVGRSHEVSHPGIGQPTGPRRMRAREASPPGNYRPAASRARRERGDIRGRGPDAATGGDDHVRLELEQRPQRALREVEVSVETRPKARAHREPSQIELP